MLTNKLNRMSMKEGGDISTYLIEAVDIKNQLNAFSETIANKMLINIILKMMWQSYKHGNLRHHLYEKAYIWRYYKLAIN